MEFKSYTFVRHKPQCLIGEAAVVCDFSDKELSVFVPRIRARFCVFCKTVPNGVLSKLTIYDIIAPETNHIGVGNERFLRAR